MLELDEITPEKFGAMVFPFAGTVIAYNGKAGTYTIRFGSLKSACAFEDAFGPEVLSHITLTTPVSGFRGQVTVVAVIHPHWMPVNRDGDDIGVHNIPMPS
jgi:hypothetical protein